MTDTAARAARMLAGLLAIAFLGRPADVAADDARSLRERLHADLHAAITLAGYPCGAISATVASGPSDYAVQCRNGRRFRVHSTDDGLVHVTDRSPGAGPAPAARADHAAHVARSLFALVNLSGYECDEVVGVEREPRRHYRVQCRNATRYRISVGADGWVAVERLR